MSAGSRTQKRRVIMLGRTEELIDCLRFTRGYKREREKKGKSGKSGESGGSI